MAREADILRSAGVDRTPSQGRVTALFFEIGKAAIGFYIGKQGLESTYGAAASIVVVLIWVYYTSQIILMGAEITHSYAEHTGSLRLSS